MEIEPFELHVPQAELDDLRRRLQAVRWPDRETVEDGEQGVQLAQVKRLRDHWLERYDWRRCEAQLNGFGQFKTQIDGLGIHFLHVRSKEADAFPLILTHGWPGSVMEFVKAIGPLTDPVAHGGKASEAFHVVVPSLPGYGFSDHPTATGWNTERTARAWIELMRRLGYGAYGAQGGDWGASVTMYMGAIAPPELKAIHLNLAMGGPDAEEAKHLTPEEQARVDRLTRHQRKGRGYSEIQSTRPQTLGYALADSPIGQAAWIYEKYREWSDCDGDPESVFSMDEMLDNIMLYWLPNAGTSSARMYWESLASFLPGSGRTPTGVTLFKKEIFRPLRPWAERLMPNIVSWNEVDRGGHFAAFETPDLYVKELRRFFADYRS